MKLTLLEEPSGKVMAIAGPVTLDNCHLLLKQGKHLVSEGYFDLILDFASVDFIDSAGMGTLISLSKLVKESGGSFQLRNLSDNIRRVLSLARLDRFFGINSGGVE